ncbi:hypothetical protein Syun_021215 [Stephania yunnanensis]|uniref:Uncharacterized protein n=1 Tax=Stephania yunnanensis TaxID=152371 RepID=A0AAP0IFD8_9MAGN
MDELACFAPGMLALGSLGYGPRDREKMLTLAEEAKLQRRHQELTQITPDQPVDDEAVYYKVAVGDLFGQVRKMHPWADKKTVKQVMDGKLYELLGERTAADDEKPARKKKRSQLKLSTILQLTGFMNLPVNSVKCLLWNGSLLKQNEVDYKDRGLISGGSPPKAAKQKCGMEHKRDQPVLGRVRGRQTGGVGRVRGRQSQESERQAEPGE